ncbi:MAG: hypothetical protein IBX55_21680 [Methyloprofundus sp.]|nr:hypothetical protein [Methyloprofundus sp.]
MMGGMKKKLVIVATSGLEEQANLLKGLISANDDVEGQTVGTRDGEVEVVVWDDKHFEANKNTLSSEQNVFFVGTSKRVMSEINALEYFEKFSKFGIKIFENGNFAALIVENRDTPNDEYEQFYSYCEENQKRIKEKLELHSSEEKLNGKVALASTLGGSLTKAVDLAYGARSFVKGFSNKKKVINQKYLAGVQVFYFGHMQSFLDN